MIHIGCEGSFSESSASRDGDRAGRWSHSPVSCAINGLFSRAAALFFRSAEVSIITDGGVETKFKVVRLGFLSPTYVCFLRQEGLSVR